MAGRKDIADRAGVSKTTVTRVLAGNASVSEKTRDKVMRVIHELGYVYNEVAAGLAKRKCTAVIALLVPDMTNYYYLQMFNAMSRRAHECGYIISVFAITEENMYEVLDSVIANRVVCIINMGLTPISEEYVRKIENANIRMIHPGTGEDALNYRYDYAAYDEIADKLIGAGAKTFCFLFCMPERLNHDYRLKAIVQALTDRRVERVDIVYGDVPKESAVSAGYRHAKALIEQGKKYDALFCLNDMLAIGAMRALKEAGLRIPQDVSVIGHDNILLGEFESHSLTTIDINPEFEAKLYIDYVAGKLENKNVVGKCSLVLRESAAVQTE